MLVKTILFDFDGVVVDSEWIHLEALRTVVEENGTDLPDGVLKQFVGKSDKSFFEYVIEHLGGKRSIEFYTEQKDLLFGKLISELKPIDGFLEFIDTILRNNVKCAIVTSSSSESLKATNEVFPFKNLIKTIVSADDVNEHKPKPMPYLKAMELLDAEPDTTLVIEDSTNGIIAGKAAGCTVFGLTTSLSRNILLEAGADLVFDSYKELRKQIRFE